MPEIPQKQNQQATGAAVPPVTHRAILTAPKARGPAEEIRRAGEAVPPAKPKEETRHG